MLKSLALMACFVSLFLSPVLAQTKLGVNVSVGEGYGDKFSKTDYQIGVPVSLTLKNNIKLLTGLEFSQKNNLNQTLKAKSSISKDPFCFLCSTHFKHDVKQLSYAYLQLPLVAKIELSGFSFQMGIVPGLGLSGTVSRYERERWSSLFGDGVNDFTDGAITKTLDYKSDKIRRFDLAGRLGFGLHFSNLGLGLNLNHSLKNLNLSSQFKSLYNSSFMFTLNYFFIEK
jgi:Outer membrane protein beta-barrel domain